MELNHAYCSDKYQYTMGKSFFDTGRKDEIAVFNLFYRKAPENNNWAVVSGTEEIIEMVTKLGTEPESFYEKFLPGEEYREFRKYLSTMRFTGEVYAMREGEIAFPNQPLVTVVGPLIEAQVLPVSAGLRSIPSANSVPAGPMVPGRRSTAAKRPRSQAAPVPRTS